jgi:2-methylcitrate dehydratase PrpD
MGGDVTDATAIERLGNFAAAFRLADAPQFSREQARRVLLDGFGAMVAGGAEPEMRALAAVTAEASPGPSTILGSGLKAEVASAAYLNAMAGCWYELDEGHRFARGHPGIHVVPVALALGEALGRSGAEVLEAVLAGYEVAARAGMACLLRPEFHPHGTWGSLGSAATAAKLLRLDGLATARSIELSASIMIGPPYSAAFEGATVRNAFAAAGCQHGIWAARMAAAGVTHPAGVSGSILGRALGTFWDEAPLTDGLGERYEIDRNYFKPYAACRFSHGALDLFLQLRRELHFAPADIASVEIKTFAAAAGLNAPSAGTPLAARFSIPVLIGMLAIGHDDLISMPDSVLADPVVNAVASNVHLVTEESANAAYPKRRDTTLTLRLNDGATRILDASAATGDHEMPLTDAELEAKFLSLAAPVLGDDRAGKLLPALRTIDEADSLAAALVALGS